MAECYSHIDLVPTKRINTASSFSSVHRQKLCSPDTNSSCVFPEVCLLRQSFCPIVSLSNESGAGWLSSDGRAGEGTEVALEWTCGPSEWGIKSVLEQT